MACSGRTTRRGQRLVGGVLAGGLTLSAALVGCGSDGGSGGSTSGSGPAPGDMCPAGQWPIAAAYDADDGTFRWAACRSGTGQWTAEAATEDTFYVGRAAHLPLDADTGTQRSGDSTRPDDADMPVRQAPTIDGVALTGSQEGPLTATDAATGAPLWTQPGALAYSDVWAVDDSAVFALDLDQDRLVAYEVRSGERRWDRPADGLWPWHVSGDRLLAMEHNLQVIDTGSGDLVWETDHPVPANGFPRFNGGLANSDTVFVSFTTEASGGD